MIGLYRFLYTVARLDYGPFMAHIKTIGAMAGIGRAFFAYVSLMRKVDKSMRNKPQKDSHNG